MGRDSADWVLGNRQVSPCDKEELVGKQNVITLGHSRLTPYDSGTKTQAFEKEYCPYAQYNISSHKTIVLKRFLDSQ
jgi:hypothetical protein